MTHSASESPLGTDESIRLTVELTQQQAWDLAQFLKRTAFGDVLRTTVGNDEEEAYAMIEGIRAVERALTAAGVAPR